MDDGRAEHVRTLDQAEPRIRALLDTDEPGVGHGDVDIEVVPLLGDALTRVREAQAAAAAAQAATMKAAGLMRSAVRDLRRQGLSVTDVAHLLGVTRGRVSQIGERDRRAAMPRRKLTKS